jgi:hypothetical protein
MFVPLWIYEWGFALRYGITPNSMVGRPFSKDNKAK